jgi:hypothetical protein
MSTYQSPADTRSPATLTRLGLACVVSGVLGILLAILSVAYPPAVPEEQWSYPFPAGVLLVVSVLLAVTHALTLVGFLGVRLADPYRGRRVAIVGLWLAIVGLGVLTVCELAGGAIGSARMTSPTAVTVSAAFGVGSLLNALGCLLAGVVIVRAGVWRGVGRWMVLASGLVLVLLVTPANISGNPVFRMVALALWSATFIPLGRTISRSVPAH